MIMYFLTYPRTTDAAEMQALDQDDLLMFFNFFVEK